jgi:hypothetical protein
MSTRTTVIPAFLFAILSSSLNTCTVLKQPTSSVNPFYRGENRSKVLNF